MTETRRASDSLQPRPDVSRSGIDAEEAAAIAALAVPTRRRLWELVAASHRDVGREEAAATLGISRELAAFHLDRLVAVGLLEASHRRLSGRTGPGAGRPSKLYRVAGTELAFSTPPRRYLSLAAILAEAIDRLRDTTAAAIVSDAIAGVARERGREAGRDARRDAAPRPVRERLIGAITDVLLRAGYEPVDTTATVELWNCPYQAVAEAHRELTCRTNFAWAQGLVDGFGDERLAARFTPGPGKCCVTISVEG